VTTTEPLDADPPAETCFYGVDGRAALLMRIANFPDEVLPLLQLEAVVAFDAIQCYRCDALVELGCYDGRSVELARSLDVRYLGVDLDPRAIATLRTRIAAEGMEHAEAVVANALDVAHWVSRIGARRSLIHLPFNFLGGFRDPQKLLRRLCRVPGALILISVFNTSEYATHVRHRYYAACGVDPLVVTGGAREAVTFTGGRDFFSRAFTGESLYGLFAECGIEILLQRSNRLGTCLVTNPRRTNEECP
jgi:hypothetical protein